MAQDEKFDEAFTFLNELAAVLQRYGVSSHSMEALLTRVAHALKLRGEFLATPTQVQSILWKENDNIQRLHISVSNAGDYDLTKVVAATELAGQVVSGKVLPAMASERLRKIASVGAGYNSWLDAAAFALCGISFAVILGLSWLDVVLAGALSLVSFVVNRLAANSSGLTIALPLIVAAVVSAVATLLCLVSPGSNALGMAVCALIYFVPGFGLTLGASELMSGNTLSGLIGFTRAAVTSLQLFVGALIGSAVVRGQATVPPPSLEFGVPHVWTWLFAPALVFGLAVLFRVRRQDMIWPVLGGLLVWLAQELGSRMGLWQGTMAGAFLLTVAGRIFARMTGLPNAIILLPAVMLLVPGVAVLKTFYITGSLGLIEGLRSAGDVVVLVAAILGGLVLGEMTSQIKRPRFPPLLAGHGQPRKEDIDA